MGPLEGVCAMLTKLNDNSCIRTAELCCHCCTLVCGNSVVFCIRLHLFSVHTHPFLFLSTQRVACYPAFCASGVEAPGHSSICPSAGFPMRADSCLARRGYPFATRVQPPYYAWPAGMPGYPPIPYKGPKSPPELSH